MQTNRLALVAMNGNFAGPWTRPTGRERGLDIRGLSFGEQIVLEHDGASQVKFTSEGVFETQFDGKRYRIRKEAGPNPTDLPTIVEVVFNE